MPNILGFPFLLFAGSLKLTSGTGAKRHGVYGPKTLSGGSCPDHLTETFERLPIQEKCVEDLKTIECGVEGLGFRVALSLLPVPHALGVGE